MSFTDFNDFNIDFQYLNNIVRQAIEKEVSVAVQVVVVPELKQFEVERIEEIKEHLDFERNIVEFGGVTDIIGQIKAFFSGIISNAVRAIQSIVRGIADGIKAFVRTIVEGVKTLVRSVGNSLMSAIRNISGLISSVSKTITGVINSVARTLQSAFQSAFRTLQSLINSIARTITSTIQTIGRSLQSAISSFSRTILSTFQSISRSIISTINSIGRVVQSSISSFVRSIQGIISSIGKSIMNSITTVGRTLQTAFSSFTKTILSTVQSVSRSLMNFFNSIGKTILNSLSNFGKMIMNAIFSAQKFLGSLINNFVKTVITTFNTIGKSLMNTFNIIGKTIINSIFTVQKSLSSMFQSFIKTITEYLTNIPKMINTVFGTISKTITQGFLNIQKFFSNIANTIWKGIESLGRNILNTLTGVFNQIVKFFSQIPQIISNAVKGLADLFNNVAKNIISFISKIPQYITQAFNNIIKVFNQLGNSILKALTSIANTVGQFFIKLPQYFSQFADQLKKTVIDPIVKTWNSWIASATNLLKGLSSAFMGFANTLGKIYEWIVTGFQNFIKMISDGIKSIADFFSQAGKHIYKFFAEDIPNFFTKIIPETFSKLGEKIWEGLQNLGKWIWEYLPDWLKNAIEGTTNFFSNLSKALSDFFKDPLGTITKAFEKAGEGIWNFIQSITPEPVKKFFEHVKSFIGELTVDPLGALWKYVGEPIWKGLQTLGEWIIRGLPTLAQWIVNAFQGFAQTVSRFFNGLFSGFLGFVKGIGESIVNVFESFFINLFDEISNLIKKKKEEIVKAYQIGEIGLIGRILVWVLHRLAFIYAIPRGIEKLANMFPEKVIDLSPLGLGVGVKISLAEVVKYFTKIVEHVTKVMIDAFALGMGFHLFEPIYRVFYYAVGLRNILPVTLPTVTECKHIAQRFFASEVRHEIIETMRHFLALRGYADWVIDFFIKDIPEVFEKYKEVLKIVPRERWYVVIKDRFDAERILPIPEVFDIPTHSEMCRMMIKDIFSMPEDFITAISMRGMNPDIAVMYYLLHFKYPSPEKLIDFYTRALAGFLVTSEAYIFPDEQPLIERLKIGESPVPPAELNYQGKLIWQALQKYFKWHDYFFANWFKKEKWKFTSDRLIVLETAFDIPTRIDARWMWKWGIFSGLGYEKARQLAPTLLGKIPEDWKALTTGESFDALMLSRINISRAMHPEWIPFITLAEMWNAYSEERTLTRTGFINLYKEGFWTIRDIEELMQGFFKLKFKILKWVDAEKKFVSDEVELPVKFLEGERKLLELRALMDRALDILRDAQREALYSAVENIIPIEGEKETYLIILEELVKKVNEIFFTKQMKELFGVERSLVLDKDYYNIYVEIVKRFKIVYTIRRLRYWLSRIMWNVYGRLMRGYISKEEVHKVIDEIVKRAKLTPDERDTLLFIAELITNVSEREHLARGILRKLSRMAISKEQALAELQKLGISKEVAEALVEEYVHIEVPTVSQLITISEVYPQAIKLLDKLIELRGIPKEFAEVWRKYAELKPLIDEVRRLVTALITAYADAVLTDAEFDKYLNELRNYGYTDEELKIIKEIAKVRKMIRELVGRRREYIPTPSQVATLSEIVPIPKKLLEQVFEARRVPDEWRPIWEKYVQLKPLIDEVRRYVTAIIRAYEEGVLTDKEFEKILETLKTYGYTDEELKIIKDLADLRRKIEEMREKRREMIPTPTQLATLAEVVAIPDELVQEVFEKRRVPENWRPIWRKYVEIRPILDEVRRLVTTLIRAYEEEVLTDKEFEKYLEELKEYGYTDKEINFIKEIAKLRHEIEVARLERREYIPTPSQLATLSEVVAIPDKLIEQVFEKRHVPIEWRDIWRKYIELRPILDEVRRYVTALIRAYEEDVIAEKEFETYLEVLKAYGYTDREIKFIREIAKLRREIEKVREERREMIPTPAQLATIAELVPIPIKLVVEVFEKRRVPPEWRSIWLKYIQLRPLSDEVRRLVTYILRAYEEGVIDEATFTKLLEELKPYGYTDIEIKILKTIGDLRRRIEEARMYYPTPSMLATIAEYVPEALKLIGEVLKERRIPEHWKAIWTKYILSRIVADDVRRTLNTFILLYEWGGIDRRRFLKEIEPIIKTWYIPEEQKLLEEYIDLRRHVFVLRRVIPTFNQLTYMYEYSTHALDILMSRLEEILKDAKISEESKKALKELWKEVARIRSVRRWRDMAIRELIYLYASGAIDDMTLEKELQEFRKWGLRDEHIFFIKKSAYYRRTRYAYIYGRR